MNETTVADTASGLEVPAGIFGIYVSPNGAQYVDEADGYFYVRTVLPDGKTNAEAEIHVCNMN